MKRVEVHWGNISAGALNAVNIIDWLKSQGLKDRVDYNWQFKPNEQVTVFYLEDHAESYATLMSLKWNNNEEKYDV